MIIRNRQLNESPIGAGPVIYWMNRDQRVKDNWAMLYAQEEAKKKDQPLIVAFCLLDSFLGTNRDSNDRIFDFMKTGLQRVKDDLESLKIPFVIRMGLPEIVIPNLALEIKSGLVVTDFSPLREMRQSRQITASKLKISLQEVDAHNIVPAFIVSTKQEWGAYTLRPKLLKLLDQYLVPFPDVVSQKTFKSPSSDEKAIQWLTVNPSPFLGQLEMDDFIKNRLKDYGFRSNPNYEVTSKLSSYFHFGQLSCARVVLEVRDSGIMADDFLEELIIRRELADNFVLYNPNYDRIEGFPSWAQKTLQAHQGDKREYLYSLEQLEQGLTHDEAWNAAQNQMVKTGYMHGYMRMYWAKKILEWTSSPSTALTTANFLNNKYELDGRDPSGYAGTAWAIGGVHDRPWKERPIFGMIRYMNLAGLTRKFGMYNYINRCSKDSSPIF